MKTYLIPLIITLSAALFLSKCKKEDPPVTAKAPEAPTALSAIPFSTTQINISWTDNSANETGFKIEKSLNNSIWTEIATVATNVTSYQNAGLTASTTYYYRVRAYNSAGNSAYTSTVSATTPAPPVIIPNAPSNLSATASSSSQINVTWTDNSNNETGFKIESSLNNSTWTEIATVAADVTSYQNTGLTASTIYYYRIRSYNSAGNSAYTSTVNATTQTVGTVPNAPTNLSASAVSSTQINISWTDNSDNETGFRIESSPNNSTWTEIATVAANIASFQNTGLSASTIYYYRVRAYNNIGNSAYSNTSSATSGVLTPAAPSNLSATAASGSQINLSWTDNSNNETGFKVERSPNGSTGWAEIVSLGANVISYQNTGLTSVTTYYYRVLAYNAGGNSTYSNTANATTFTVPSPAPSNLTATAVSSSQINLSWTDNANNETGFKVERSPDGSSGWTEIVSLGANVTSYQNTGLTAGTIYYYRVLAYNTGGNSAYSNTANATTGVSAPIAPSNLTATAASSSQINLTWTDNSNNETGFRVERSLNNSTWTEIITVGSNVTSYLNTGLTASTTYYYRVRAYNAAGNSAYTTSVSATTNTGVPATPANLTATGTSTSQINLSWTDNAGNEQGYIVERAPGGTSDFAEIATLGANTTTYSNTGLSAGTTYNYRVKAYNAGGSSGYSNTATANTYFAQTIPTISAPSTSTGTFTITMTYPFSGFLGSTSDGYYLEESTTSPTTGFTLIQSTTNTRVTSWTATLTRATGTYYYRVRIYNLTGYSPYSSIISVSVNVPAAKATLHIVNSTRYDMIDIRLNGTQYVTTAGTGVLVGNYYNVDYTSSGTVTYTLGVGFWDGTSRNVWFYLSGTANVTVGSTTNLTFNNPTISQLLTGFGSSRNWNGYYFDANSNYKTARFNFTSSGGWTFYDNGVYNSAGSVTLVSWSNYAIIVTFKICSTCETIQLPYPFGSFLYRNGPGSWPIIEYTGQ